jgi:hypothetical protein
MGKTRVYFVLIQGVGYFIWEYTGGKAGDDFGSLAHVGGMENVVVDQDVIPEHG